MLKKLREPVNGLTHYFGAIAAVVGLVALLFLGKDDLPKQRSLLVYGASLALLLIASASYHLLHGEEKRMLLLKKIDHAAIYFLIAGSYTPLCVNAFTGFWRWGLLTLIWTIALVGSLTKIFIIQTPRWVTASSYLLMGWFMILAIGEVGRTLPVGAIVWLMAGGITFTLGAVVYVTKKLDFKPGVFGFHEVWHIFVLVGCFCHFIMVAFYIAPMPRIL